MTVHPGAGGVPMWQEASDHPHSRLARAAVGIAGFAAGVVGVCGASVLVALAVDGWAAVEDLWNAWLAPVFVDVGVLTSLLAFGLAIVAKVRHERWALLRLPLFLFPALAVVMVLAFNLPQHFE